MKFKWKYVAWILPVMIMYAGAYALHGDAFTAWWGFPTFMGCLIGGIASFVLEIHLIVEDK